MASYLFTAFLLPLMVLCTLCGPASAEPANVSAESLKERPTDALKPEGGDNNGFKDTSLLPPSFVAAGGTRPEEPVVDVSKDATESAKALIDVSERANKPLKLLEKATWNVRRYKNYELKCFGIPSGWDGQEALKLSCAEKGHEQKRHSFTCRNARRRALKSWSFRDLYCKASRARGSIFTVACKSIAPITRVLQNDEKTAECVRW